MNTFRKATIATFAAAIVTVGTFAIPTQANAGGFGQGFVAGVFLGAAVSNANPYYGTPVYTTQCSWQTQFTGYDYYGRPVYQNVRVCY